MRSSEILVRWSAFAQIFNCYVLYALLYQVIIGIVTCQVINKKKQQMKNLTRKPAKFKYFEKNK